ncbi:hypothetical protein [Parabacteroides sp.]|uniref:hypothetical protein n=1 Tax=Parabacteroides sp. TaxID=1869337 RepID=UPI002580A2CE|nr:hypothetical protein [Parabacteroides sp.]
MFPLLISEALLLKGGLTLGYWLFSKRKSSDPVPFIQEFPEEKSKIEDVHEVEPAASGLDLESLRKKKLSELLEEISLEDLLVLLKEQTEAGTQSIMEQVSENLDAIYTDQIAKAQDFVNGSSSKLNIHAVRELLRDLLPEHYHPAIKKIKQGQSVKNIINILGGNNQVLPNAENGITHIEG